MSLFAVTAVVLITHVAVDAFVAHENAPAGAALHATSDGLAPDPAAEQFVVVAINGVVSVPVNVGDARGAHPVQAARIPAAVSRIPLSVKVQVTLEVVQASKWPVVGTVVGPRIVLLVVAPPPQVVETPAVEVPCTKAPVVMLRIVLVLPVFVIVPQLES
jgi:hypothetical protein